MKTPLNKNVLMDRFIIPPFSVLDSSQGYWAERKKLWMSLGIASDLGREEGLTFDLNIEGGTGNTSVFDPVLAELSYRWFTSNNAKVLDPFSGGSVRGIVAGRTGRSYVGVDLRKEQIEENVRQVADVCPDASVRYVIGDSTGIRSLVADNDFDFIFSCPPYGDLEVYSDDPNDLSCMKPDEFLKAYRKIVSESVALLKPNRFAAFVVGDYRAKNGTLVDFTGNTIRAFEDAGCGLHNHFIFMIPCGTLPQRVTKQFNTSRKMGMRHQSLLVFIKGDVKRAVDEIGTIDTTYPGGVFANQSETSILDLFGE